MEKAAFLWVCISCLIVQTGFGAYGVVVRLSSDQEEFNMLVFSAYRDVLCFPLLCICCYFIEGEMRMPKTIHEWIKFAIIGVPGVGVQQFCYIMGLFYTNPSFASIWQPTIPVW